MTVHNVTHGSGEDISFDNLYLATIQCCGIILLGYIAGRTGMLNSAQMSGIAIFISKFSLPCLLFLSMCELKFEHVDWWFLLTILLSKSVVFALVIVVTVLVKHPPDLGLGAIFAIFCTQSNDFAFGYPMVNALYKDSHPNYPHYIYLIAPISVVILNPIGFTLLEYRKQVKSGQTLSAKGLVIPVLKGVALNPIVSMTIVGVIGNFVFHQHVPDFIRVIISVLASTFSGSALFYLGLSLVNKIRSKLSIALVIPAVLIMTKTILCPLLTWEIASLLETGLPLNETKSISMYAFFYGTIPTAPTVYLYANTYDVATDIIASGMVVCTFVSAPFMMVSAKMMTLEITCVDEYLSFFIDSSQKISIAGIVFCVFIGIIFIFSHRYKGLPHLFTLLLVLSQLLLCIGIILYKVVDISNIYQVTFHFVLVTVATYSSRCWCAAIAVALYLICVRGVGYVHQYKAWFLFYGFGVPTVVTGVLIAAGHHTAEDIDPSFYYGKDQTITSTIIIFTNIVITVIALILLTRFRIKEARLKESLDKDQLSPMSSNNSHETTNENEHEKSLLVNETKPLLVNKKPLLELDDVRDYDENHDDYDVVTVLDTRSRRRFDPQVGRHVVLLLFLTLSLCVGIFLCIWRIFSNNVSGIYIEIEFLDIMLLYGQSFFVFAVFGLDSPALIAPLVRRFRNWWYKVELIHVPMEHELPPDVRLIKDQFTNFHLKHCSQAILGNHRFHGRQYRDVFRGYKFVDWLMATGLVCDRTSGLDYGRKLLIGSVIQHVKNEHHFYDSDFFYRFTVDHDSSD